MATVEFYKYHGNGNDFIIIDNRNGHFKADGKIISNLCSRRFGVGADGLMLLEEKKGYDFHMRYFNCDGNEATMCGNGGRCIAALSRRLGVGGNNIFFSAADGEHRAVAEEGGTINLKLSDVSSVKYSKEGWVIDTGSPHLVVFMKNVKNADVYKEGKKIRNSNAFKPGGINVNFAEKQNNSLFVRTYERGVEDETLSCGTGSVASAIAAFIEGFQKQPVPVETRGGWLKVQFDGKREGTFSNIWLSGPAKSVFKGTAEL